MPEQKQQIVIRPASSDDFAVCCQLDHSLDTRAVWQLQKREDKDRDKDTVHIQILFQTLHLPRLLRVEYPRNAQELSRELIDPAGVLVAEAVGRILGYVHIRLDESASQARVRNLVVDRPWRKRRIGWALLEQARAWARLNHATALTVETTTRSYPAIQFLLAQGLTFCGFSDRYYAGSDSIALFFGQKL